MHPHPRAHTQSLQWKRMKSIENYRVIFTANSIGFLPDSMLLISVMTHQCLLVYELLKGTGLSQSAPVSMHEYTLTSKASVKLYFPLTKGSALV